MWDSIYLTLKLASISTIVLVLLGTPMAWWLARSGAWWKEGIAAIVALPLVLPPTVLGFYLLIGLGPDSPLGQAAIALFGQTLPFSFAGLVVGAVIFSLPFVVQPIRIAFEAIGERPLEVAATLRAGPLDRFISIALPLARKGFLTGSILGFAHTIGEFGVVLMIGGNIPEETRVLSIAIFDHVEALEWDRAHLLAGGMLAFSFCVILLMMVIEKRLGRRSS